MGVIVLLNFFLILVASEGFYYSLHIFHEPATSFTHLYCSKVGDNGEFVFLSGTALDRVLNPVQIWSVLAKI